MAVALSTLVEEADRFLGSSRIADYCPNGLQVEGRTTEIYTLSLHDALPIWCWCITAISGKARIPASWG